MLAEVQQPEDEWYSCPDCGRIDCICEKWDKALDEVFHD